MLDLKEIIDSEDIILHETDIPDNLDGLYIDNNIFIDEKLDKINYNIVLSHELGHHFTLEGNNILENQENKLQEFFADAWSYKNLLPLEKMAEYKYKEYDIEEICETECVNCDYIEKAFKYYKEKYGNEIVYLDDYKLRFYPNFQVVKLEDEFYEEY